MRFSRSKIGSVATLAVFSFILFGNAAMAEACNEYSLITLPEPTGEYGVGTVTFHLESQRLEELTPETDDYRQIQVQLWYPVHKRANAPTAPYKDAQSIEYLVGDDAMFTAVLGAVTTHAQIGALPAVRSRPFPLLVFSPGYGNVYSDYQSLIE